MSAGPPSASLAPGPVVLALPGAPAPWRSDVLLFAGTLLVLLAWFVGPFGVYDLYEYAQDAESLWLDGRWDMRLEHLGPRGEVYSRFSIGLPILSGPFVLLGAGLEWLSGGAFHHRWLMALMSPLATAGAAVALAGIARALRLPRSAGTWGGLVLVLSGSGLYYSRLFYVEPVVGLLALLGLWAVALALADGRTPLRLALLAGFAFGMAAMCHNANAPGMGVLSAGAAWVLWRGSRAGWRAAGLLLGAAALPMAGVLAMNWHRFGGPLVSGYTYYDDGCNALTLASLPHNLRGLAIVVLGVPWLPCAIAALVACGRTPTCAWRRVALAVLAALAAQECLWLAFKCTWWSPLRYHVAFIMLAGVGLPPLAVTIARRWPQRGLTYATLAVVVSGLLCLITTKDFCRPLQNDPEDPLYPGQVTTAAWYAAPGAYRFQDNYTFSVAGLDETAYYPQVPLGLREAAIMGALIAGGALLLRRAWLQAHAADALLQSSRAERIS